MGFLVVCIDKPCHTLCNDRTWCHAVNAVRADAEVVVFKASGIEIAIERVAIAFSLQVPIP